MGERNHSHAAYQLALVMRPIINDLADEIASAERGKPTARKARKIYAKDAAINRLISLTLPTPAGEA